MLDDENNTPKDDEENISKDDESGTLSDEERTKCEVWTRVMGYHRPTTSFNIGKQGEFEERKFFCESKADENEKKKRKKKEKKDKEE